MALTTDVKAELVSIRNAPPQVRVAEVTTILRFAGGLHSIAGRVAVEAEVDALPDLAGEGGALVAGVSANGDDVIKGLAEKLSDALRAVARQV